MHTPILDRLIEVMKVVAEKNLMFEMDYIYASPNAALNSYKSLHDRTIHSCGTACCVMGYAVFDKKIQDLGIFSQYNADTPTVAANLVWGGLIKEIGEEAADSIAGGTPSERFKDAKDFCKANEWETEWLNEYLHITPPDNINTDSPQDAVDYMVELKRRLDELYDD